jgi:hypothetical protein
MTPYLSVRFVTGLAKGFLQTQGLGFLESPCVRAMNKTDEYWSKASYLKGSELRILKKKAHEDTIRDFVQTKGGCAFVCLLFLGYPHLGSLHSYLGPGRRIPPEESRPTHIMKADVDCADDGHY